MLHNDFLRRSYVCKGRVNLGAERASHLPLHQLLVGLLDPHGRAWPSERLRSKLLIIQMLAHVGGYCDSAIVRAVGLDEGVKHLLKAVTSASRLHAELNQNIPLVLLLPASSDDVISTVHLPPLRDVHEAIMKVCVLIFTLTEKP